MPLMLPSRSVAKRSVVGVADELLAALDGTSALLAPARSAVLVVVDGLGAIPLRQHAGHARRLAGAMGRKDVAETVFPSTTAAALTSILTGAWPGEHGLVGYTVRHPETDALLNQLTDWEKAGIDPARWQASTTVFEQAVARSRPAFAVGVPAYASSGFTRAVLRGAEFVPAKTPEERVARAYELASRHPGALVYCYLPECDKAGHKHGVASEQWIAALETVDAALAQPIPEGVGVLVTSDHGMVDVPAHRHVVVEASAACLDGVRHVGGEPRMLHLYLAPDAHSADLQESWRAHLGEAAAVVSRREAIDAGLFGPAVDPAARERMGDLLVIARGNRAIYAAADPSGRGMVGQHGALEPEETRVPLIRLGVFS